MHHDDGAVKTAAALEASSPRSHGTAHKGKVDIADSLQHAQLETEAAEPADW
jgi:hypothetical protein